jgi:hypothetical protein
MGMVIGFRGVISSRRSYLTISVLRPCAKSVISAESASKASDDPDKESAFRDLQQDETQREVVIESLWADSARSGGGGLPGDLER